MYVYSIYINIFRYVKKKKACCIDMVVPVKTYFCQYVLVLYCKNKCCCYKDAVLLV